MKKQKDEEIKKKEKQAENECQCEGTDKKSDCHCDKPEEEESCGKHSECKELTEKLEAAQKAEKEALDKLAKEKDDYVRLMAEFETFRRRSAEEKLALVSSSAEEKLALVSSAASDTIKGLLPVLDDCERAMELLQKSSDEAAKEGTGLIYDKLMKYLKSKGLERIEAKGQKFDTDFHEAVAQVPVEEEDKKGLIYDVIETGYTLNGKILRYAKVVVGI